MQPIKPKLRPSYFVRQAVVFLIVALIGAALMLVARPPMSTALTIVAVVPIGLWAAIVAWSLIRSPRVLDAAGVTRRDGRRFLWDDLVDVRNVRMRMSWGSLGPVNQIDLRFPNGKVRIFPFTLENAGEVMAFVNALTPGSSNEAAAPFEESEALPSVCRICSQLREYEHGFQKGGRENEDTFIPAVSLKLKLVREFRPGENRSPQLQQCPECGAYYVYETDYEFLVYGSEDEQTLTRWPSLEAAEHYASDK